MLSAVVKTATEVRPTWPPPRSLCGAATALILVGTLPFWDTLRKRAGARAVMRGVNAAVVGLLGAALYNPVWTSSVKLPGDFAIALVGFVILTVWRAPLLLSCSSARSVASASRCPFGLSGFYDFRRRSALATTLTEDSAIAAAAMIGDRTIPNCG